MPNTDKINGAVVEILTTISPSLWLFAGAIFVVCMVL